MRRSKTQHSVSSIASSMLLALFGLCVLSVLLSGAGVYGRMVSRGQETYSNRTCAQYVSTKVHQCPGGDWVRVESFDGVPALTFLEEWDGEAYATRVYCYEGWLMELFSPIDEEWEFYPEDGEKLLPAQSLSPVLTDGLLQMELVDEYGHKSRLVFSLRGGEGACA